MSEKESLFSTSILSSCEPCEFDYHLYIHTLGRPKKVCEVINHLKMPLTRNNWNWNGNSFHSLHLLSHRSSGTNYNHIFVCGQVNFALGLTGFDIKLFICSPKWLVVKIVVPGTGSLTLEEHRFCLYISNKVQINREARFNVDR